VGINGRLDVSGEIGVRHRRIAEFLLVRFRNSDTLAQLAPGALRRSNVCHAYGRDLLRASVRLGLRMLFGRCGLGQTCSNSISPRRWAAISFIASTRSCPKLGFCDAGRIPLPVSRSLTAGFCDVDCDVTPPRIGENDRFAVVARQFAPSLS
jgi:hypothetical protein